MILAKRKSIAAIALAAIVFGALSPAIAAALFAGRSEILGRMLAIPAASQGAAVRQEARGEHDGSAHVSDEHAPHGEAHGAPHANSNHNTPEDSEHAAHNIVCSLCLSSGSTIALPAPAAAAWEVTAPCHIAIPAGREQPPAGVLRSTHHPRDPPLLLS
jgi:hypothetical protein